jgi:hypothetical protein
MNKSRTISETAAASIWTEALDRLKNKIRPNFFQTYLAGTLGLSFTLTKIQKGLLEIGCSNRIQVDGIQRRLKPEITAEVSAVVGMDTFCSIRLGDGKRRSTSATLQEMIGLADVALNGLPPIIPVPSEQLLEQELGSIVFSRRVPYLGLGQMESFNTFGQVHVCFRSSTTGELMTEDAKDIVYCGHVVELDGEALLKLGQTHRNAPISRASQCGAVLVRLPNTDPIRFQWLLPPFSTNVGWVNREYSYGGQTIALEGYELPETWTYFDIQDPGRETEIHVPVSRRYSGPKQENWLEELDPVYRRTEGLDDAI